MAKVDARFIKLNNETLKKNEGNELEVKLRPGGPLEKTAGGISVKVNDDLAGADNLWSSQKISGELSARATIAYVDNAIIGLRWKEPVRDFITQSMLEILQPQPGDRYIITDGANINRIAHYGTEWNYTLPLENWVLLRQTDDACYTYDPDIGESFKWRQIGVRTSAELVNQKIILSAADILAKKIVLEYTPQNPAYVKMAVRKGCEQDNGVDFFINPETKEVSWSGTELELLLIEGDTLLLTYSKEA